MKHKFSHQLIRLSFLLVVYTLLAPTTGQPQNHVYTYAGTGLPDYVDGDTSAASFNTPYGITLDADGNLYIADGGNHVIRKISTEGVVSTYAGTGSPGYLDGPAAEASFNNPFNLCFDPEGNLFVSDFLNQRIRKISPTGMVTTVAGIATPGYLDGPALEAQFNYPRGICFDDAGNLYVSDSWNHRIRKISPDGMVSTWAGGGTVIGVQSIGALVDSIGTDARFYTPTEISIDSENNIFVADAFNHRIRKIDANQQVTTVAGSGDSGPNAGGFQNGPGEMARFNTPTTCHVTVEGDIFIGDGSSHLVRRISPEYVVSNFAGSGIEGFTDGPDSLAEFNFPRGIAKDYERNRIYVVDFNNHAIRYIQLETVSGTKESSGVHFQVFPNPFNDHISLQLAPEVVLRGLNLVITNNSGQVIYTQNQITTTDFELKLNDFPAGLYYLSLRQGQNTLVSKKMIKL